ncbi:MAG: serine hydrolase [Bacteroidales bacterium]|nr:serine hydrolase [Bacteroidales bacterium]
MKVKRILGIAGAVLAAAVLGGCIYLNTLMPIITGYAAKNLASAVFVSGRQQADVEALDLHFSFIKFVKNKVDFENQTVTSRFLWAKSKALYREGWGVTLLRGRKAEQKLRAQAYPLPIEEHKCEHQHAHCGTPDKMCEHALNQMQGPYYAELREKLAPLAEAFVDEHAYNGHPFAFIVLKDGKMVAERYGDGITPHTQLLSWSMGKSFTNALVGIMAGDGLVDIYAPTGIPEWQNDERAKITLSDLMQMQSGLEWNEDYGNRSDVNLMLHREQDMGLYAINKPLEHEPGTFWYYSSGSTNIVMRYLRSKFASNDEFLQYIHDRLFEPLGIRGAHFEPDMTGTPVGSSYLYVTARDYARFAQMFLDDGVVEGERILPEGWVDYTRTPASASEGGYGAFFWLNRGHVCPDVPEDMYSCNGHDGQQIYIIPSKGLVVVILSYSPKPDRVIEFNRLLKDIISEL